MESERGGLDALRAAVDAAVAADPADLSDGVLADELILLRREMDRLDALFARLAAAAHGCRVGAEDGATSTAAWLSHHASMRTGDARAAIEHGAVAGLLADTGDAWLDGDVSTAAFRTIAGARVEGHDDQLRQCEEVLLGLARDGDLVPLRRAAAHFRNLARSDGSVPGEHDGLHISKTFAGTHVLNAELCDLAAETVVTALHAYTDPPTDRDTRTPAKRRADALVRICEVALDRVGDRSNRPLAHTTVVIDWRTLTGSDSDPLGRLDGQYTGPIHRADVERLLCDCSVARVVTGPDALPLDIGRASRSVPAGVRRALSVRDGGCRHPGCDRPPGWCDAHHVVPWTTGGPTALQNLVLLCDRHHQVVHQPGWTAKFDGHLYAVYRPDGTRVL
jgi:hypothetical protein